MNQAFLQNHRKEIETYAAYYRQELLDDLIPFWQNRVYDRECGGFFSCFDREGKRLKDIKSGWFVGRNTYTFANLYNTVERREDWLALAEAGADWLLRYAHQGDYRFNSLMDRRGGVLDGSRSIFNDSFSVKGYLEYLAALGDHRTQAQVTFAREAMDALLHNAQDEALMVSEGMAEGRRIHALHFMMLLCAMESEQVFGPRYRRQAQDYAEKIMCGFENDTYQAVFETLDEQYQPVPMGQGRLMDPGHALESCWFLMKAGKMYDQSAYLQRAETVLDWIWEKGWDKANGGLRLLCDVEGGKPREGFETEDYYGTIVHWNDKIWWAQAEGLNALAISAIYNANEMHFQRFGQLHAYVDQHFRDHQMGEWYAALSSDNRVIRTDKGMENKGPYHVVRCAAMLSNLFEQCLHNM